MNSDLDKQEVSSKTKLEQRGFQLNVGAPVTAAVSTPENVVVGFGDGTLRFFRPSLKEPDVIEAHKGVVLCMVADGNNVFTGGEDGRFLRISNTRDINEIANFDSRWVDSVAAFKGNFACSSGRNAYVWSLGQEKERSLEHTSTVGGLAFDSAGNRLAVSSYGGVTIWERGERRWKSTRFVWKGSHGRVSFSPNDKYLVTAMQENELHGWRIRDKQDLAMSGYPAKVKSFTWVGDTPFLVTSGASEAIYQEKKLFL